MNRNKLFKMIEMDHSDYLLLSQIARSENKDVDTVIEDAIKAYLMTKQQEWKNKQEGE